MKPAIKQFSDNLPAEKRTIAIQIRELIFNGETTISKSIKWGNLTFVHGKQIPAFIHTSKNC